ncbi:hypothetical protein [Microcoleus sp. A003_D6]|uniref:hypothetical protein n=1 Tax=Microcoleus sp. A003_D6 TaxID=3055266 RepID=UPI002FD2C985
MKTDSTSCKNPFNQILERARCPFHKKKKFVGCAGEPVLVIFARGLLYLEIYPPDGRRLLTAVELDKLAQQERQEKERDRTQAQSALCA